MKKQAFNPYLPSYEYVPDGEPYVFGDRLYVYGSHDAFGGKGFCVNDYVCYSASVDDLGDWRYEGIIYKRTQDPVNPKGHQFMNAPDVCQGPDGRFYLYYQLQMENTTSVAVSDVPEGPFEYYGVVHHPNGKRYGLGKDAYNFDPSVFMDDDGRIYMYTGFSPDSGLLRFVMGLRGGTYNGGTVVELEKDMLTIKGKEISTIPGKVIAAGTEFEEHPFFEASSMRKINGLYYLVYSSLLSHELCYATSTSPIGPWKYGSTIVSIGDIGLPGITKENPTNFIGNTHGGMVCVNGQWYIFYHRQTNQQKCARQGCAEKIYFEADGSIKQVEVTSCGLNPTPMRGIGTYEARIACNLWGKNGNFDYNKTRHKETEYPYFTQSGKDREENPDQYIANMMNGAVAGFKYFDFSKEAPERIQIEVRGTGRGVVKVSTEKGGASVANIKVEPSNANQSFVAEMQKLNGTQPLYFEFKGEGCIDFISFTLL